MIPCYKHVKFYFWKKIRQKIKFQKIHLDLEGLCNNNRAVHQVTVVMRSYVEATLMNLNPKSPD